jgi:LPS O-antigen subunit length determinant protein (WzzB/FepE family)
MNEYHNKSELMYYLNTLWERKWLIVLPTLLCIIIAAAASFFLPKKWEVDSILMPSKFFLQTEQGQFEEVIVVAPKQIVGQINHESYNRQIAAELKIDMREFPKVKAEKLNDTNLVRIAVQEQEPEKAKAILTSLFALLKADFDKKIDVEIKDIDTQITSKENDIKKKEIDIKSLEINKEKSRQQILSSEKKQKISEQRVESIHEEMELVKKRTKEIEDQQKKVLEGEKQESNTISLLLYSTTIQQNLQYYNTLDEKLSNEKMLQETLKLLVKENKEEIKKLDTVIEKTQREIKDLENEIDFLRERKARIDYTQLIKEPTTSLYPVSPNKRLIVVLAAIVSLGVFSTLALFLEYIEKQKVAKDHKNT